MSSPVFNLLAHLQVSMSGKSEMHPLITDEIRENVLRGVFEGYYRNQLDRSVIFDTNRAWCGRMFVVDKLFPKAKVVCCVRAVPWILDSVERIVRSNPLEPTRMFGFEASGNVYARAEALMGPGGMVGSAMACLKDAFNGVFADRLVVVPYEALTAHPEQTIAELYGALGEEPFAHDFDHVEYNADDFDFRIGARGLHKVSGKVEYRPRELTLPSELAMKHHRSDFWNHAGRNPRNVRVLGPRPPSEVVREEASPDQRLDRREPDFSPAL